MAARPAKRPAVGAAAWCAEERTSAVQITESEIEEFAYSARNEVEWLNEHMAEIFSENQMYVFDASKYGAAADRALATSPTYLRHQGSFVEKRRGPRASYLLPRTEW